MSARVWEVWKRDWWIDAPASKDLATRYNELQASGASVWSTWTAEGVERLSPTFRSYVADGYQANGIIYAVILARLMLFSEAEFKFQNLRDKHLHGDPGLAKLEIPWPNGSTGELLVRMEQDASLAGNAFIRDVGPQLERLRPDRVTIISEIREDFAGRPYRVPIGYAHDRDGMGQRYELYDVSEVAHWSPVPDPLADFRGMSWLTPIVRELAADGGLTDYKIRYMENAATPNLLIRYPNKMKPSSLTELSERISARYGGVDNAYRTLALDEGADATVIGSTFEQLRFNDVQAAGENRIAAAGGVPGIVVGLKEGLEAATYSNYEQAMRRFADLTMRPNWRSACAALAKFAQVPADSRLWFDESGIAALRQGEKERAETFAVQAKSVRTLVDAGYTPDSVQLAVPAGDLSLLVHSNLYSVQLQSPGAGGTPEPTPPTNGNMPLSMNGARHG